VDLYTYLDIDQVIIILAPYATTMDLQGNTAYWSWK
jgi:hypothetical protein